ncbi:excisionase [Variovorax sp. LjRoot175]|uniref:excisionase n=1 Tax=Variovorax sp. LjRoot175 TaxID=3342276 RepID=UPI003ECC246D
MSDDIAPPVFLAPDRYVTIALYAAISGYSQNAIRCKIKAGTWIDRREYIRAPDGHVMIDRESVQRWLTRKN